MRSGTTRCGCSQAGCATHGDAAGAAAIDGHADRARALVQRALLVRRRRLPVRRGRRRARRRRFACRPNQLLAISLPHPVLDESRWERGAGGGARTAADAGRPAVAGAWPPRLQADATTATCATRDAAYHQGTVWAWLIGPIVDAWLKRAPRRHGGRTAACSRASCRTSERAASGRSAEIFDAEPPFTPRGCVAQAWSVAEVLRGWLLTEPSGAAPRSADLETESRAGTGRAPAGR